VVRGIPTTYQSTQFRSRLEARWAAFFDLVGWQWVYEPFDATGWIPDFLIRGKRSFLVEVGPCVDADQLHEKADKPSRFLELPTLVLGVGPTITDGAFDVAGLLVNEFRKHPNGGPAEWSRCEQHGFSVYGDDVERPCGCPINVAPRRVDVDELWRRAGNDVQWKP
jgi:hypothetical protein